jgi:heterodisulfide reductase subunit A
LLSPLETRVEGVYLCGGATGPIDIAESVVQATAAAMKAVTGMTNVGKSN